MGNDAYELQALNGLDKVPDGQTFTGTKGTVSRGFQVTVEGTFEYECQSPKGSTITFQSGVLPAGTYIGGPLSVVTSGGGGECAVIPSGKDYTIA